MANAISGQAQIEKVVHSWKQVFYESLYHFLFEQHFINIEHLYEHIIQTQQKFFDFFYLTKLDFACIKRDYMQESYNPTDFFIGKCPRTN